MSKFLPYDKIDIEATGPLRPPDSQLPFRATGTTTPRDSEDRWAELNHVKDMGAKGNGADLDAAYIQDAINDLPFVRLTPGTFQCEVGLTLPAGKAFLGYGRRFTKIRVPIGVNALITLGAGSTVSGLSFDGTTVDPVAGATGLLVQDSDDVAVIDVEASNFGFHGFAVVRSNNLIMHGSRATNCGQRGLNISDNSKFADITGFRAQTCREAGVIVGNGSTDAMLTNIGISGCRNVALWAQMNAHRLKAVNVQIEAPEAGYEAAPAVIVTGGSQGVQMHHVTARGYDHGLYLWNLNVLNPELGNVNGPINRGRFTNFHLEGRGTAGSNGVYSNGDNGQVVQDNEFDGFYIHNFAYGVRDVSSTSARHKYRNFSFGTILTNRFQHGTNADLYRTAQLHNFDGITRAGHLTVPFDGLQAQPAVPATGVAVANPYPFDVAVYIRGLTTPFSVQIGAANVTDVNDYPAANGVHILPRGQSITLNRDPAATPVWRWFALN